MPRCAKQTFWSLKSDLAYFLAKNLWKRPINPIWSEKMWPIIKNEKILFVCPFICTINLYCIANGWGDIAILKLLVKSSKFTLMWAPGCRKWPMRGTCHRVMVGLMVPGGPNMNVWSPHRVIWWKKIWPFLTLSGHLWPLCTAQLRAWNDQNIRSLQIDMMQF